MEPRVSVVVPVYNALPYLTELLDSLAAQDLDPASFDVMAVDDGSTDGSSDVLDDYSRRYGHFHVIHQTNSGRPGRPRNVGLRSTSSSYVFFADADDRLGPACLRRLVDFAEEHASDVVIPKMIPLAGRGFPTAVYEKTLLDADLVTAFRTLFPQKLYRRSVLVEHDIWFPEGVRLDDGIFNAHAYVRAKRISILSDYDYYCLRARGHGTHLSRTERDPATYTASVAEICRIVRERVSDPAMSDRVVLDLFRRKCLLEYDPRLFGRHDQALQEGWIAAHRSIVERFISEEMEQRLESPYRERSYFIRRGDRAGLLASSRFEAAPAVRASVTRADWTKDGLEVGVEAAVDGRLGLSRQLTCQLLRRAGDGDSAFPIVRREPQAPEYGQVAHYDGVLPLRSIQALVEGTYDLHLVSRSAQERLSARASWGEGLHVPAEHAGLRIYGTKSGHVSVKKTATVAMSSGALLRRLLGPVARASVRMTRLWMAAAIVPALLAGCGGGGRVPPATPREAPATASASDPDAVQRLYESGRYREVLASANPGDADAVWFAAQSNLRLGQREEAARQFAALPTLDANPAWQAVSNLALALLAGDADALNRAEAAAAPFPGDPFVQFELGLVYTARKDSAGAAQAFDRCAEADPRFAYAYFNAALAYDRLNRQDLMAIRLEMFLRVAPEAPERPEVESILRTIRGQ